MLSDAQEGDVISSKPWIWMPPALMIMFTILSINFVGEGLKDAFNPKIEDNDKKRLINIDQSLLIYLLRPKPIARSIFSVF